MSTVLVVSYRGDGHAVQVMKKMDVLGQDAILWDISKFPTKTKISFLLSPDNSPVSCIEIGDRKLEASEVTVVFWRRPRGAASFSRQTKIGQYIKAESEVVIQSLFDYCPRANWLSPPENTRLACRKPVQLDLACQMGVRIPKTCISNSPKVVSNFLACLGDKKLTMKPVGSAFVPLAEDGTVSSPKNKVVFTRITNPKIILKNIGMVKNCPVIFQEVIEKDYDIRVTVVDEEVFAAGIHIENCKDTFNLDWRNYGGTRVYKQHKLPELVKLQCVQMLKALGLRFGCLDWGFSEKEGYTFFEINPQGQWLPSEQKLGYNISGKVVSALVAKH